MVVANFAIVIGIVATKNLSTLWNDGVFTLKVWLTSTKYLDVHIQRLRIRGFYCNWFVTCNHLYRIVHAGGFIKLDNFNLPFLEYFYMNHVVSSNLPSELALAGFPAIKTQLNWRDNMTRKVLRDIFISCHRFAFDNNFFSNFWATCKGKCNVIPCTQKYYCHL